MFVLDITHKFDGEIRRGLCGYSVQSMASESSLSVTVLHNQCLLLAHFAWLSQLYPVFALEKGRFEYNCRCPMFRFLGAKNQCPIPIPMFSCLPN